MTSVKYILLFFVLTTIGCSHNMILTGGKNTADDKASKFFWSDEIPNVNAKIEYFPEAAYSFFICECIVQETGMSKNRKKEKTINRRSFTMCYDSKVDSIVTEKMIDNLVKKRSKIDFGDKTLIEISSIVFIDDARLIYHSTNRRSRALGRGRNDEYASLDLTKKNWRNRNTARGYYKIDAKNNFTCILETFKGRQFEMFGKITDNTIVIEEISSHNYRIDNDFYKESIKPVREVFNIDTALTFHQRDKTSLALLVNLKYQKAEIDSITRDQDNTHIHLKNGIETKPKYYPW